jgi:L-serine dehydratase
MVGPSSSHTAGAVRLGALARAIFGEQPEIARISLHGSFADTGEGHGTLLALVAGLLGLSCDDPRIPDAFELAKNEGLDFSFDEQHFDEAHPNTAEFLLEIPSKGKKTRILGSSIGGGNVTVNQINDFEVEATGMLPLIVVTHIDKPGVICAVTGVFGSKDINIASMKVSREFRGAKALMMLETDMLPKDDIVDELLLLDNVSRVRIVPAV